MIFDLVNVPSAAFLLDPANKDAGTDSLADKNVTTMALEIPTSCLVASGSKDPVIGGWTTASVRQGRLQNPAPKTGYDTASVNGGAWTQVSRLGMPLVNEVVIGLNDKDKFNASSPKDDGQFATYVTNPTLPKLLEIALATPNISPTNFPRNDLVTTFLTGIVGVNQPATVTASEMLRLNTAIPAVPYANQNRLGLLGGLLAGGTDLAGYPNGRRPNDDVVDISLVAVMGGLCVANGTGDTYKFGAACNPSAVPLGTQVYNLHDGGRPGRSEGEGRGAAAAGLPVYRAAAARARSEDARDDCDEEGKGAPRERRTGRTRGLWRRRLGWGGAARPAERTAADRGGTGEREPVGFGFRRLPDATRGGFGRYPAAGGRESGHAADLGDGGADADELTAALTPLPALDYNSRPLKNKGEKGMLVMTPRTTTFFTKV